MDKGRCSGGSSNAVSRSSGDGAARSPIPAIPSLPNLTLCRPCARGFPFCPQRDQAEPRQTRCEHLLRCAA